MPSQLPQFGLRTTRELLDKIRYIAEYHGRSANKEIEQLIKEHVSRFEKEHGEICLPPGEE